MKKFVLKYYWLLTLWPSCVFVLCTHRCSRSQLICSYSVCPSLSCWATARSRWTCRCSLGRPTIATCGPTPSTRCTASLARPSPPPARRSSLPALKFWKFHFFLKIICQPGTSQHELAIRFLFSLFVHRWKKNLVKLVYFPQIWIMMKRHISQSKPVCGQSEVKEQRGREAPCICVIWLRLCVLHE